MNPAQVLAFMKEAAYLPKRTYMSSDAFAWLRALGFEQHEPELTDLGVVTVEDMEGLTTELLEQTTITTKDINKLLNGVRGLEDQMAPDMEDWLTGLGLRAHIPAFEQAGLLTLEQMAGLGAEGSEARNGSGRHEGEETKHERRGNRGSRARGNRGIEARWYDGCA